MMNMFVKKWSLLLLLFTVPGLFSCRVPEKEAAKGRTESIPGKGQEKEDKPTEKSVAGQKKDSPVKDRKPVKTQASLVQSEGTVVPAALNELQEERHLKKVRFSFKEVPASCRQAAYVVMKDGSHVKIMPHIGLLSPSVFLPAGEIIEMYDKAPVAGVPQGNKILSTAIPDSLGEKVVSVVIPLKDGGYDLVFIDQGKLEPGTFYLHNLTNEQLGMQIDQDKIISLGTGDREFVVLGYDKKENNLHPVRLFRKDEKGKWFVTRQFALLGRTGVTDIVFLVLHEGFNKPDVMKIAVADEPASVPAKGPGEKKEGHSSSQ